MSQQNQIITVSQQSIVKYTIDPQFNLNANVNSGLPLFYQSLDTRTVVVNSSGLVSIINNGKTLIKIFNNGNQTWAPVEFFVLIEILKKEQFINSFFIENKYGDDLPFSLNPYFSATSGLPIKYKSLTPNIINIDENGIVTILNIGTAKFEVYQEGNTEWAPVYTIKEFGISYKEYPFVLDLKANIPDTLIKFNLYKNMPDNSLSGIKYISGGLYFGETTYSLREVLMLPTGEYYGVLNYEATSESIIDPISFFYFSHNSYTGCEKEKFLSFQIIREGFIDYGIDVIVQAIFNGEEGYKYISEDVLKSGIVWSGSFAPKESGLIFTLPVFYNNKNENDVKGSLAFSFTSSGSGTPSLVNIESCSAEFTILDSSKCDFGTIGDTGLFPSFPSYLGPDLIFTEDATVSLVNCQANPRRSSSSSSTDENGKYQIASVSNEYLYISDDFGLNWSPIISNQYNNFKNWGPVDISDNGNRITAFKTGFGLNDPLYTSFNFGESWVPRLINESQEYSFKSISVNSNARIQTAVSDNAVFITSNYGSNWNRILFNFTDNSIVNRYWRDVAVSNIDGKYQTLLGFDTKIWTSENSGQNWSISLSDYLMWEAVDMSEDGRLQSAVAYNNNIYLSNDFGRNWSISEASRNLGSKLWKSIAISNDGKYQTAVAENDFIYISNDFGNSLRQAGVRRNWKDVDISYDGKNQTAITSDEKIYISKDFGQNWVGRSQNRPWSHVAISKKNTTSSSSSSSFINENVSSSSSLVIGSSSSSSSSIILPPATPTNLQIGSVTDNGFILNWSAVAGATSYEIQIATSNDFNNSIVNGYNNKSTSSRVEAVNILTCGVTYYIRVRARNSAGESAYTNPISQLLLPCPPTNISFTNTTDTSFVVAWANVTSATSYRIDVATNSNFTDILNDYNDKLINTNTDTIINLNPNSIYYIRVRSVNNQGTSQNSTFFSHVTLPAAPSNVLISNVATSCFRVSWNSINNAISYRIDIATDDNFSDFVDGYENRVVNGSSIIVYGLTYNITYYIRVRAFTSSGAGAYSSPISQTTNFAVGDFIPQFSNSLSLSSLSAVAPGSGNDYYVGGNFTNINGNTDYVRVAHILENGVLDINFKTAPGLDTGPNNFITSILYNNNDNKIYIGGYFTGINNIPYNGFARLNSNGTLDTSFQNLLASVDFNVSYVRDIKQQPDGKILIGGNFFVPSVPGSIIQSSPLFGSTNICRLNSDGTVDNSFTTPRPNGIVTSICLESNNKILIGGTFASMSNTTSFVPSRGIARLNNNGIYEPTNWGATSSAGFNGPVYAIAVDANNFIYVGGVFTAYDGRTFYNSLAKLFPDGTRVGNFNYLPGVGGGVEKIIVNNSDNSIIIAGNFNSIGNQLLFPTVSVSNIAKIFSNGIIDSGFNPCGVGTNALILDMKRLNNNNIAIVGPFTLYNQESSIGVTIIKG
jgi:hypothetical protein